MSSPASLCSVCGNTPLAHSTPCAIPGWELGAESSQRCYEFREEGDDVYSWVLYRMGVFEDPEGVLTWGDRLRAAQIPLGAPAHRWADELERLFVRWGYLQEETP